MFKLKVLDKSHLIDILKLNNDSKKVYGNTKTSLYDREYENWIIEILNFNNKESEILGVFNEGNELIQYALYYHISTWPAVVVDHWRSSTAHKHKGVLAATEWTKMFAEYIAKKDIFVWYIIVEKGMWDRYTKLQKDRFNKEPPNYRFLLEEVPAGEKSKFLSFNTYLLKNQTYDKAMYVFQMVNKDKYY